MLRDESARSRWQSAAAAVARSTVLQRDNSSPSDMELTTLGRQRSQSDWRDFTPEMLRTLRDLEIEGDSDNPDGDSEWINSGGSGTDECDGGGPGEEGSGSAKRGQWLQGGGRKSTQAERDNFASLHKMFRANKDFITEYLIACLKHRRGFLARHIAIVDDFVRNENENNIGYWTTGNWHEVFEALYSRAVTWEDTPALREALVAALDGDLPKIKHPRKNSPALIKAALMGHRALTKLLVLRGYFLEARFYANDGLERRPWWRDLPCPFFNDGDEGRDGGDEVQNLHVLRAMATPCYILTCYTAANKIKFSKVGEADCKCCQVGFTAYSNIIVNGHLCPINDGYIPAEFCTDHPECNDPIYRCFEMASATSNYAHEIPEYREEYLEVSDAFNELAVELLEQCRNNQERELLLKDPIGSNKFFRKGAAKRLTYPRLQMALVNEHHAFAGHMFCQEILRAQWLGRAPLDGKKRRSHKQSFTILYVLVECLFILPYCFSYTLKLLLRECGLTEQKWRRAKMPNGLYKLVAGPANLDDPINRFIAFSFFHLVYLLLIITAIVVPIMNTSAITNNFHWYHSLVAFFTFSLVAKDITVISASRNLSQKATTATLHLWHIYDIITHAVMSVALIVRLMMGQLYECVDEVCGGLESDTVQARLPFDTVSNCLFSVASAMAGVRVLYWFQLHDRFGPIVINFNRVVNDIITFTFIFLTVVTSFALSLVPLVIGLEKRDDNVTRSEYCQPEGAEGTDIGNAICDFLYTLGNQVYTLFWLTLNPEAPETFTNPHETMSMFGGFLIIVYAIFSVIVFLNLLIATMNSTISKVSDKQHVYWKFVRAGIWLDYFGDEAALPPPFNLITVSLIFLKYVVHSMKKNCGEPVLSDTTKSAIVNITNASRESRRRKRREYRQLTTKLISRYWNTVAATASRKEEPAIHRHHHHHSSGNGGGHLMPMSTHSIRRSNRDS